jgi:hypothetical protein
MLRDGAEPAHVVYNATDLTVPVYRVVVSETPTADDFVPYIAGNRSFPPRMFFQATGVSMFTKKKEAEKLARGGKLGSFVAELHLDDDRIFLSLPSEHTSHLTVWSPSRLLLKCLVSCAEIGKG